MTRRWASLLIVAVPPLLLAALGLSHPMDLTVRSAVWWRDLHLILLPLFPLLALGPWYVVRREHRAVVAVVVALGFGFAVFYTGLDVLAGIAAGAVKHAGTGDRAIPVLFIQGHHLATIGVRCYLAATLLAGAVVLRRRPGIPAAAGALIVAVAAVAFQHSHIYWPVGVLTMVALAIGWTTLAWTTSDA